MHHPQGDIKKICQDTDSLLTASFAGAPCWRVASWEAGVTEGGSSGSPLYDQDKRIVGQLFGGQATCSFLFNDYYGRFDQSWTNGLRTWLDPLGTNPTTLDGIDAGQGQPVAYCTAKINSNLILPQVSWFGEPSLAANNFVVGCIGGIANANTILFWGQAKASTPFFGGFLCIGGTITREPLQKFDSFGFVQYAIPITAQMVGTKRYYQFWGRDPQHPDGTGVLLSDALEVPFKP
jgi:hypothetical protein